MNKARLAEAGRGIIQKRSANFLREKSLSSICVSQLSTQQVIAFNLKWRVTGRKDDR